MRDSPSANFRREVSLVAITRLAVIVAVALVLALLVVTLAMLLVPSLSWAAVYEWMTTGHSPCGCILDHR
jgi:hypothetical protein